ELLHDLATIKSGILDLAVKLAVGKQACTTLAKLDVRFWRQFLPAPERPGIAGTAANILAPFQHDWSEPHLCEQQCGEQTAGTQADDDRSLSQVGRCHGNRIIGRIRRQSHMSIIDKTVQYSGF